MGIEGRVVARVRETLRDGTGEADAWDALTGDAGGIGAAGRRGFLPGLEREQGALPYYRLFPGSGNPGSAIWLVSSGPRFWGLALWPAVSAVVPLASCFWVLLQV